MSNRIDPEIPVRLLLASRAELKSCALSALKLLRQQEVSDAQEVREEEMLLLLDRLFTVALLREASAALTGKELAEVHSSLFELDRIVGDQLQQEVFSAFGKAIDLGPVEWRFYELLADGIEQFPTVLTKKEIAGHLRHLAWRGVSGLIEPDTTVLQCVESAGGLKQLLLMVVVMPHLFLAAADLFDGDSNQSLQEVDPEVLDAIYSFAPLPRLMWYPYLQRVCLGREAEEQARNRQDKMLQRLMICVIERLQQQSPSAVG